MDIFPSLVNTLVNAGLVKGMKSVLEQSMGFIDLSEACIKSYEKIVVENPPAVLRSGAVQLMLAQMDFFVGSTQNRIFKIIQKIARHSSSESDFDEYILPIIPFIVMNLNLDYDQQNLKKIEDVAQIIKEVQESFTLFYSPINDFDRVCKQNEKLLDSGLFDIILTHVKSFADTAKKILKAKEALEGPSHPEESSLLADTDQMQID